MEAAMHATDLILHILHCEKLVKTQQVPVR